MPGDKGFDPLLLSNTVPLAWSREVRPCHPTTTLSPSQSEPRPDDSAPLAGVEDRRLPLPTATLRRS